MNYLEQIIVQKSDYINLYPDHCSQSVRDCIDPIFNDPSPQVARLAELVTNHVPAFSDLRKNLAKSWIEFEKAEGESFARKKCKEIFRIYQKMAAEVPYAYPVGYSVDWVMHLVWYQVKHAQPTPPPRAQTTEPPKGAIMANDNKGKAERLRTAETSPAPKPINKSRNRREGQFISRERWGHHRAGPEPRKLFRARGNAWFSENASFYNKKERNH